MHGVDPRLRCCCAWKACVLVLPPLPAHPASTVTPSSARCEILSFCDAQVLLRRKTTWARRVGSWKKEEPISGLAWSVAWHLVHALAQARRDWPLAVNNGCRTVRPSTIRLRCCVAWHMAASHAACGLDCVISEHHGRLELKYSRSTVTVVGGPACRATRFVESACVMRCEERAVHPALRLATIRSHWHFCENIRCPLERKSYVSGLISFLIPDQFAACATHSHSVQFLVVGSRALIGMVTVCIFSCCKWVGAPQQ